MMDSPRVRPFVRRWAVRLAWSAVLVFATIVVGGGLDARRRLPDLEPWHRIVPRDVKASDLTPRSSLGDYLAVEEPPSAPSTSESNCNWTRLRKCRRIGTTRTAARILRASERIGTGRRCSPLMARRSAARCSSTA